MMKTIIKTRKITYEKGNIANSEFDKLTDDEITSIFVRCPVKTLSMLRCVSKSWNDLIISPSFYSHHLKQSLKNAPQLLIMDRSLSMEKVSRARFVSVDTEVEEGERNELYNDTFPSFYWFSRLVCNGLVCISTGDCRIFLCNPVMQQVCELPKCSPTSQRDYFGFGYLHSKKEYKVVHFFYRCFASHHRNPQFPQLRCEVFTINDVGGISNSRWKEIVEIPSHHANLTVLFVNECMYWLATLCLDAKPGTIFSIDFENDKFLTISQPSSFKTRSNVKMLDLKGMFCLVDQDQIHKSFILDLWILKDKINCIWVKEYSIDFVNFRCWKYMFTFGTWNEEIIFILGDQVIFYNFKRNNFRRVKNIPILDFGIYHESLFSLGSNRSFPL